MVWKWGFSMTSAWHLIFSVKMLCLSEEMNFILVLKSSSYTAWLDTATHDNNGWHNLQLYFTSFFFKEGWTTIWYLLLDFLQAYKTVQPCSELVGQHQKWTLAHVGSCICIVIISCWDAYNMILVVNLWNI